MTLQHTQKGNEEDKNDSSRNDGARTEKKTVNPGVDEEKVSNSRKAKKRTKITDLIYI